MKTSRTVLTLSILLFASLSGNVFLGGWIAGHMRHAGQQQEWQDKDQKLGAQLSAADRATLRKAMRANREKFAALRKEMDEARKAVRGFVRTGDEAALDAALAAEQAKKKELLRLMQQSRAEAMQEMSPEGQAAMRQNPKAADEDAKPAP